MTTRLLCLALSCLPLATTAQDDARRIRRGDTILVMPVGIHTFTVTTALPSRVRVPPLESVRLQVPDWVPGPIQWLKNQVRIPDATDRVLELPVAAHSDSGLYQVESGLTFPYYAAGIQLDVVNSGSLGNFSSRVELSGSQPQIVGFVVTGKTPKLMLYRAVGPSLTQFGLSKTAPQPRVQAYDAQGRPITPVHLTVAYDFPAWFASLGAFPLTGGEDRLSFDFYNFAPGAYTVHVWDGAGTGGTALVELYDAEDGPATTPVIESVEPAA